MWGLGGFVGVGFVMVSLLGQCGACVELGVVWGLWLCDLRVGMWVGNLWGWFGACGQIVGEFVGGLWGSPQEGWVPAPHGAQPPPAWCSSSCWGTQALGLPQTGGYTWCQPGPASTPSDRNRLAPAVTQGFWHHTQKLHALKPSQAGLGPASMSHTCHWAGPALCRQDLAWPKDTWLLPMVLEAVGDSRSCPSSV